MTDWNVTIANRALARIGGGAIGAFDEDTPLAAQVRAVYDDTVEAALTAYQWSWARRTSKLDKLAGDNPSGYVNAFGFPAGALGDTPLALFREPRNPDLTERNFRVEGRTIYCDADALWGSFIVKISPDLWQPLFRLGVTTLLAAELCIPVAHDKDLAAQLREDAIGAKSEGGRGGMIGRAIGVDAAGGGTRAPLAASDPITSARFTGPAYVPWHGGM
jgi:hypothetical protein